MDDSITKLATLYEEFTTQGFPSQTSLEWLRQGCEKLSKGNAETMDEAFGVNARAGVAKSGVRLNTLLRNKKLIVLLKLYTDKGMSNWAAATELGASLRKFKIRTYPRIKENKKRLKHTSELEYLFWELFEIYNNPPCSASFLHGLLSEPPIFTEKKNNNTTVIDNQII